MKTIRVEVKGGKATFDFEGFAGDSCSDEEKTIRLFLGQLGVKTDEESTEKKTDPEAVRLVERERA
ncbi:MAG: hypothetical protein AAB358_02990 [Patescibacteria group bacterium]